MVRGSGLVSGDIVTVYLPPENTQKTWSGFKQKFEIPDRLEHMIFEFLPENVSHVFF